MKLKSIEIHGFKSFDDKTRLFFDDQITGIVGPNGCGKSNIVDAIRWVMGEQSAKHLRGKIMEDVIFAGAEGREPSSVASVELTFLTQGTQTPPQYIAMPEISVGRKLYRTGESEYYINRQAVRLKDITDLFLGTGVGTKAYSIIEQGRVGQIITAKPEERRYVIEEAAGISKFKLRKEAALRRMEATGQNLLRLRDIVSELERQKQSLERQAKKAEKFKVVKDELMTLDLTLAALDFQNFQERQNTFLARLKELDTEEISLSSRLAEGEAWTETQQMVVLESERKLSDLQQLVYEWENTLRLAETRLQQHRDRIGTLNTEISQVEIQQNQSQQDFQGVSSGLKQINQKLIETDLDNELSLEAVTHLQTQYETLDGQGRDLFAELEKARADLGQSTETLVQIRTKRESLGEKLTEWTAKKQGDETELEVLTKKYTELNRLVAETSRDLAGLKQIKMSLGERSGTLAQELIESEAMIGREQADLETLREELLQKKSRLSSLEELERNFEGFQDGPRALLTRKRSGDMDSVIGAVADLIETEPHFEGAVAAVLGERMQALVVKTTGEGMACAQYLKSTQTGRSSFLPLLASEGALFDSRVLMRDLVPAATMRVSGYRGLVSDVVRVLPEHESLKKVLFGDVVLVEELTQAMEYWTKCRSPVVTLEGEMIAHDGVLTGGTLEHTSKALLEKKREIKELGVLVMELVERVRARSEICADLSRKIQTLKRELEDMRSSGHQEEIKITSQEKDITHLAKEMAAINARRGLLAQQVFETAENLDKVSAQLTQFEQDETYFIKLEAETREILITKKPQEETLRAELSACHEALTHEKIAHARLVEQRIFLEVELNRLIDEKIRHARDGIRCDERRLCLIKQRLFLEDVCLSLERHIQAILKEKVGVDGSYRDEKNSFEQANAVLRERDAELKTLRHDHAHVKDELNACMVQLTELRGHISRINEQTLERYQMVIATTYRDYLTTPEGFDYADAVAKTAELRQKMSGIGAVNLAAIDELKELNDRYSFLNKQREDLEASLSALERAIHKINRTTKERFEETFHLVNDKFSKLFPKLFQGGQAYLKLTDPDNILETGVDIIAQPPGKKLQSISLLSGGEKALTAVSLLFAIFLIKPAPFCLLDEVDAPLDDANVDRYNDIVKEMSERTQFIVITHNKRTMQVTNCLYGITMQEAGVSQLVSVKLDG